MKPWERYAQRQPAAPPSEGPWTKYQQAAPPAQPEQTWGEWAVDKLVFPHEEMLGAVGHQVERAGQAAMAFPGQAADFASDVLTVPAKTLAGDLGVPVAPITPEQDEAFRSVMVDLLMTVGGAKAGQVVGSRLGNMAKYIGRGGRTTTGVVRDLPMMDVGAARQARVSDLWNPVLSGVLANRFTDWMNPASPFGGGEFGDAIIAGGAGVTTSALMARNTLTDLMTTNPRYRALMMSPSKGQASALLGAAIGHMLSRGVPVAEKVVNDLVDEVARQLEGAPYAPLAPVRHEPGATFPLPAMGETRRY